LESNAVSICAVTNNTDLAVSNPLRIFSYATPDSSTHVTPPAKPLALRIGYDMQFEIFGPHPTAMLMMLYVHPQVTPQLASP
jgi:hypothetical protein